MSGCRGELGLPPPLLRKRKVPTADGKPSTDSLLVPSPEKVVLLLILEITFGKFM